ncbi:uncharacterized protein LOC111461056 isoform X1 [Cucurbita moschata]|uniref:Uncharacterized protein LOC111461056 isoform X1 n=2 Tax=Cucurbita moschata TaxID=3662 RepID=A0A6J1H6X8_CUCMO|nr:uncharacterized protein LOC111461056 isoform X1 [Cucurbita moschata]
MAFHEIHSWTLSGLVRAFIDLALVYVLLCVSATVFIPSKILKVVGLCLPCPCTGFYGNRNFNLCLHRLLVSWPKRKICLVLELVKGRFPFDLILIDDQMDNTNWSSLMENHHTDGIPEACCSTLSGPGSQNSIHNDSEHDGKGKRIMYRRPRTKIRRRRTVVEDVKLSKGICEGDETRKERGFVALVESQEFVPDDSNESNHVELSERNWQGFESSGSVGENDHMNKGSSTIGQCTSNAQERDIDRNEVSCIRLLDQAHEETARASLFLELEKERAAAATAVDEAIAMITRLQNEKASAEMEARQYQRALEEKIAYDEEEMNILREILVKREIDYHVLEKKIKAYRLMDLSEKEQLKRKWDFILDEREEQSATTHSNAKDNELRGCDLKKSFVFCGVRPESLEHIEHAVHDLGSSILDMEIDVQDIHMID